MPNINREELKQMTLAARLYYEDRRTQEEVSKELGVSRPIVSRLLQKARDTGIVQININDPFATNHELAKSLMALTDLEKVIVVSAQGLAQDLIQQLLGLAAAQYLEESLKSGDVLGVGWGRTLNRVVESLDSKSIPNIEVLPLLGGFGQISPNFQVHEMTRRIAESFKGSWQPLYAPALSADEDALANLIHTPDVQNIMNKWKALSVALVGIGNVDFDAEMQSIFASYLDPQTRQHLTDANAVGDICVRFFDIHGQPIENVLKGVLGIELESITKVPRVIGVAGGIEKADAILGAVQGGYLKELITDDSAALQIITYLENN